MRRLYELLEIEERMLEVEERMLDGRKQGRVLLGVPRVAVTEPMLECMELASMGISFELTNSKKYLPLL